MKININCRHTFKIGQKFKLKKEYSTVAERTRLSDILPTDVTLTYVIVGYYNDDVIFYGKLGNESIRGLLKDYENRLGKLTGNEIGYGLTHDEINKYLDII